MAATRPLLMLSDNLVELRGLRDAADDSYINNATVTLTLKDSTGATVTGQTFPTTLAYVSASNGNYQGTLEDDLTLTEHGVYTATISIDAGADKIRTVTVRLQAREDVL